MKKCVYILLFATTLIVACNGGNSQQKRSTEERDNDTVGTLQFAKADTLVKYYLTAGDTTSPCLTLSISIDTVAENSARAQKINRAISGALFNDNNTNLATAIEQCISQSKSDYDALRPEYINVRGVEKSPAWMNRNIRISGTADYGTEEVINYNVEYNSSNGMITSMPNNILLNFDSKEGNEIWLDDIFVENYEEPLCQRLTDSLALHTDNATITEIREKGSIFPTENFLLGKEGITFIYNSEEISPHIAGNTTITIKYSQLSDIMKQKR